MKTTEPNLDEIRRRREELRASVERDAAELARVKTALADANVEKIFAPNQAEPKLKQWASDAARLQARLDQSRPELEALNGAVSKLEAAQPRREHEALLAKQADYLARVKELFQSGLQTLRAMETLAHNLQDLTAEGKRLTARRLDFEGLPPVLPGGGVQLDQVACVLSDFLRDDQVAIGTCRRDVFADRGAQWLSEDWLAPDDPVRRRREIGREHAARLEQFRAEEQRQKARNIEKFEAEQNAKNWVPADPSRSVRLQVSQTAGELIG